MIVFAPHGVRLTWMGYQLYLLMAVIVLKYGIALQVGSPENNVAQALLTQQMVQLATMRPSLQR